MRLLSLIIFICFLGYGLLLMDIYGGIIAFGIVCGLLIEILIRINELDLKAIRNIKNNK
jgi:hypothetical protein